MSRNADEVMTHHINTMMELDVEEAMIDYSENLVAITRLDGHNRVMGYESIGSVIKSSAKLAGVLGINVENAIDKLHILFRQSFEGYIVLTAELKPFSSFASFTYMVEDDRAIYVSGYAQTAPMPSIGVKGVPYTHNEETMAVMNHHLDNLKSRNAELLVNDYSDDVVVITNLSENPLVGKDDIAKYCNAIVNKAETQIAAITSSNKKIHLQEAVGELACLGFSHKESKQHGILTQRVQNGKIVFESAIFKNVSFIL